MVLPPVVVRQLAGAQKAKTPAPVVQRLAEAARGVVGQADFARGLAEFGMTPRYLGPRELAAQLRAETEMWRGHIKKIGFTSES